MGIERLIKQLKAPKMKFTDLKLNDTVYVVSQTGIRSAKVQAITKSYIKVDKCRFSKATGQQLRVIGGGMRQIPFIVMKRPSEFVEPDPKILLDQRMRDYFGQFGDVHCIGIASEDEYYVYFVSLKKGVSLLDVPKTYDNLTIIPTKVGKVVPA